LAEFLWWVGGACAVASVLFAGLAVWPRVGDPHDTHVFYWGDVRPRFESDTALGEFLNANPIDAVARTRNQFWVISGIVRRKYRMIRRAMVLGTAAIGFLIVSGLVVVWQGRAT
jgi:hypothetical protein